MSDYLRVALEIVAFVGHVESSQLETGTHLVADLAFDSLSFFEIYQLCEEVTGRELPDELLMQIETIGDLSRLLGGAST